MALPKNYAQQRKSQQPCRTGEERSIEEIADGVLAALGKPASLKTITIGYDAVGDLLARRVAAATAFWNDEGVTLADLVARAGPAARR